MSSSSTAVFGNAAIAINAIEKACSKMHQNLLLCQGLSNIIDGSGYIADLGSGGMGNIETLLISIANMINYLDGRGWVDVVGGGSDGTTGSGAYVKVIIKLPYNTNLQNSTLMNIYSIVLPVNLFKCGAATSYATEIPYVQGSTSASEWTVNTKVNMFGVNPSTFVTDLVNLQQSIENITDLMTALAVINA